MKVLIIVITLKVLFLQVSFSQNHSLINYNTRNFGLYNPAASGMESYPYFYLIQRSNSIHLDNMPSLTLLNGSLPFRYERMGVGMVLMRESAFISNSLSFSLNYSYKINFLNGRLSFGLRSGLIRRSENLSLLSRKDEEDLSERVVRSNLIYGGGIAYKDKIYNMGLSYQRNASIYLVGQGGLVNEIHTYFTIAKKIQEHVVLYPNLNIRYLSGFPLLVTIGTPVEFKNKLLIGVLFNSSKTTSFSIGLNAGEFLHSLQHQVWVIYSYDHVLGALTSVLGNTHELTLKINFGNLEGKERIQNRKITVSPLYFN